MSVYSASSFIDGILSISYPNTASTNRIFPVGKGSIYRPVTIEQTLGSTSPVVQVEMINTPPTGSYPGSVGILSEARYYAIDLLSGTMNSPTITLSFNTNGTVDEAITVPGNVRIMKATTSTGPWTDEGGSGVFSPAAPAGYATSGITSIVNPSYFTLAYQNALPISLAVFEGVLKNDVVELTWSTYSEKNNSFFTVERSADGMQFEAVGSVDGAGNSQKTLRYHLVDSNPLLDVSYYRLKQTDYDKQYSYSDVIRIVNTRTEKSTMLVYPNPSRVAEPVFIKLTNPADTHAYVMITDIAGRVFYSGSADLTKDLNIIDLNLRSMLEAGVYFVRISSGNFKDVKRIVIYR